MCPSQRDVPGCPGNPGILSIPGSLCAPASGMSLDVLGIPGYLVFRDPCVLVCPSQWDVPGCPGNPGKLSIPGSLCAPSQWDVPGCPGNPGILSIPGSLCAPASGMSRDVLGIPGYLVFRDPCVPQPAGCPWMSWESRDT